MHRLARVILLALSPLITILLPFHMVLAQSAIQAHYADGQIWVVWDYTPPGSQTFVIYGNDIPIGQLSDGEQVGRLFEYEYVPGALREQFGPAERGWIIPSSEGAGVDTLDQNQALFVETVHATGPRYFAVVAYGDTTVTPGVNATTVPADGIYAPDETVECHLQLEGVPLEGYSSQAYAMWADGREDPDDRRPDVPVCANPAKNGMPSIFVVSKRDGLPLEPHPVIHWLHGGGGQARSSLPGKRPFYNIDPDEGLLVAHNDNVTRGASEKEHTRETPSNSWWFGWGVHYDPFTGVGETPPPGEIIVNYTQRRLVWINEWLIRQGWVDPGRVSVQGHSMGSAGATALGKAFPDVFATCTILSNGFEGPVSPGGRNIFGYPEDELKSVFVDAAGDSIPVYKVFDLNTILIPGRDLPLFRCFHGKNDTTRAMGWDAVVVEQYRTADSLGMGVHLYWDERAHSPTDIPGHWAAGTTPDLQTERDNVAYQEPHAVSQSFPAFYDHRLVPGGFDPGDGDPATGDPWGTWGGYHDWELDTLVDELDRWEATVFLIDGSAWLPDNCPVDSMPSSLTIRRAQAFDPQPGEIVNWAQLTMAGDTLRVGSVEADTEGRVRLVDFMTYRDPDRTRVKFERPPIVDVAASVPAPSLSLDAAPNPFNPTTKIRFTLERAGEARLTIYDANGRLVRTLAAGPLSAGAHGFSWDGRADDDSPVASGVYWVRVVAGDRTHGLKLVVVK